MIMSTFLMLDASSTTSLISASLRPTKHSISAAGNFHRLSSSSSSLPPSSKAIPIRPGFLRYGIGGAGNCCSFEERSITIPEEEISRRRAQRQNSATSRHHGIGGAGNRAYSSDAESASSVEGSSYLGTERGGQSGADKMKERLVGFFGVGKKRFSDEMGYNPGWEAL